MAAVRIGVLVVAVCMLITADVQAQSLVVSRCIDKTGTSLGKRISSTLRNELQRQGNQVVDFGAYLKEARKRGLISKVNKPTGVRTLAKAMDLSGVVTCFVNQSKGRYRAVVRLFDSQGVEQLKKVFLNKKPRLAKRTLIRLALTMIARVSIQPDRGQPSDSVEDQTAVALVPLVTESSSNKKHDELPEKSNQADSVPAAKKDEKRELTAQEKEWAALLPKEEGGQQDPNDLSNQEDLSRFYPEEKVDSLESPPDVGQTKTPTVKETTPLPVRPKRKTKLDSLSNVLMVAGASMYTRAGLSPRVETGFYPGMHFFGRFLFNTFTDIVFLKDLGISALYEQSFGLKYTSELSDDRLHATQRHIRFELLYRLSFENWKMAPAFLIRLGYGVLNHAIDASYFDVFSVRYNYFATTLQSNLWLVRPWLGCFLGLGYLVDVQPGGDLAGNGTGITFSSGIFVELEDVIYINLGYEQLQFLLDERSLGDTSDRYQVLFLRFGLSYH